MGREGDDDHDDHHDDHHGDHESLGPCACLGSRLKLDCSDIAAINAAEAMLKSVLCTDEEAEHVCHDHKECADAFLVIQVSSWPNLPCPYDCESPTCLEHQVRQLAIVTVNCGALV